MITEKRNCINCKNYLKIGICKYNECEDFEHFEPLEKDK